MAVAKTAVLRSRTDMPGGSALITLQMRPEDFPAFRGGRYIILNTGLPLDDGKTVKRAYSILDYDSDGETVTLGIKGLEGGAASPFLCQAEPGQEFFYSGPWGKLECDGEGRSLLVATYTGITALLGLLRERKGDGSAIDFVWYRPGTPDYFLQDNYVRGVAEARNAKVSIRDCPSADNPEHEAFFSYEVSKLSQGNYGRVLLAGDGRVNRMLRAEMEKRGLAPEAVLEEVFFHKQR